MGFNMRTRIRNADIKAIKLAVAAGKTAEDHSVVSKISAESLAPFFVKKKAPAKKKAPVRKKAPAKKKTETDALEDALK